MVLICLDAVRADHLGAYGYARPTTPALDALAARALVFADASATAAWTTPSVPSLLTGTYPCQHGVYEDRVRSEAGERTDLLPPEALTLAEVFQAHGYLTSAFVHPAQLRTGNGFEQGFERYEQDDRDAREIRRRSLDWLDQRAAAEREQPFFLYLHFLDVHWPYAAPEEWLTRFAPATLTERFRGPDARALYSTIVAGEHALTSEDIPALVALYDGALAYLDSELGHFLDGLAQRGLAGDTIVCVVADHGEEFGEHGRVGHGHGLWEDLLRVPWILFVPGRAGARHDAPVSLVDLFPTLLASAGITAPAGHEGVDRLAEPGAARAILAEHKASDHYVQSLRSGSAKLQRTFTSPAGPAAAELVVPLELGTRWDAELERAGGELVVTELRPREGELDGPPELAGRIVDVAPTSFRLGGLTVRHTAETEHLAGAGTGGPELVAGRVVRVRGRVEDFDFHAERIELCTPGEGEQLEIRGTAEALEPAGDSVWLTLSGLRVRVTARTDLRQAGSTAEPRILAREDVLALLAGGAGEQATARGLEVVRTTFDLARDRAELAPGSAQAGAELDGRLEALGRALAAKRLFGAQHRKALDAETLRELEALGCGGK